MLSQAAACAEVVAACRGAVTVLRPPSTGVYDIAATAACVCGWGVRLPLFLTVYVCAPLPQKSGDDTFALPQRTQVVVKLDVGAFPADVVFIGQLRDGSDIAVVQTYDFVHVRPPPKEGAAGPPQPRERKRHASVPACPYVWLTNSFAVVDPSMIIAPAVLVPDLDMGVGLNAVMHQADGEEGLCGRVVRPSFFWVVHVTPHVVAEIK